MFRFVSKPLRDLDKSAGNDFLQRFLNGPQIVFEGTQEKINELKTLNNPAKIRADLLQYLKDHVGLTKELNSITNDLSENDLRKLIALAVPLWKQKGLEVGYQNILRLFTGKGSRVFNWFDFRWVLGEKALGSEFLGEDAWLISKVGLEGSVTAGNVALLLNFEGHVQDVSIYRNHAKDLAKLNFYRNGAVTGSKQYASFDGGTLVPNGRTNALAGDLVQVPYHSAYEWGTNNLTIEMYVRTKTAQNAVLFSQKRGGKEITIRFNSSNNTVSYTISDSLVTVSETLNVFGDLDNGGWKHIALVLNRNAGVDIAKIFVTGNEASTGAALNGLSSITMSDTPIFIGGETYETSLFKGDIDCLRVSKSDQYGAANITIPVPGNAFPEYLKEGLDEYRTDIRVVDDGDLNRVLIKRILNLMRPISERLDVIYITFFEDFESGKGSLETVSAGSEVVDGNLVLPAGAVETCSQDGNEDYQDMVLQVRSKIDTAGNHRIRFLIQDTNNYYRLRIDQVSGSAYLEKVVGGVVTVLSGPVTIPVSLGTFYIYTVVTDYNEFSGEMVLKCYQDANLLFEVVDATFNQGTWAVESSGGQVTISELEMFLMPLDVETVLPGFSL